MIWIITVCALFLFLLLFPIMLGLYWYHHNKENVLPIRQDRRRDPRYFAKSFDELFQKAWNAREDGYLKMSRAEQYLLADDLDPSSYPEECGMLVVAQEKELRPPAVHFCREICAAQDAWLMDETHLRAVRAHGNLLLGRGVQLDRWADADGTVAVYDNCHLGISVTAGQAICIGRNCTFRRIFAPVIHLGAYPDSLDRPAIEREKRIYRIESAHVGQWKRRHVGRNDVDESRIVPASLVTSGNVTIDEDLIIQGNVRTRGGVQLAERAVICGDLFADQDVYLSRNSTVLGSVFTQGDVYCETGVVIGQEGRISSVIARGRITVERDCFVYGYLSNEGGGWICPVNQMDQELPLQKEQYLEVPKTKEVMEFEDQKEFEKVDEQGFRHNPYIRKVVVPEDVKEIPDSMFFDCRALEEVVLPASLEEIGEYVFGDCVSLKRLDLRELKNLRRIRRSAFNGCIGLEEVLLPDTLEELEPAVFCNCSSLQNVAMPDGGLPRIIGSHCFQNCPFEPVSEEQTEEGEAEESSEEEVAADD